ncbi:capsular biosynthesis protein [bacterium]|nr:capsular biosynthesis protein [bacterium]MBU1958922.1 capsular biosynthesis protein [bacterium]
MNLFSLFEYSNPIKVDIHSHLLPGIDDGVRTIEEAVAIIKKFQLLGYSKLITTPHIISDFYPNNRNIINKKLHDLQEVLKKENIEITIEASAEYYVDMEFLKLIENEELIPFMGRYVLFETSYSSKPMILEQAIFEMIDKGYIPVLAHPERYIYLHHDFELYKRLKAQGVLFQVNIKSLQHKSRSTYKVALHLINSGLVDFIGSDVHRMQDIIKLEKILQSKEYKNVIKKNKLLNNI